MRLLLLLLLSISAIHADNIVIYLTLVGKSHLSFVSTLISILVDRGHNVDIILGRLNTGVSYENMTKARNVIAFGFPGESPWMKVDHLSAPFDKMTKFNFPYMDKITTDLCMIGIRSGEPLKFLKEMKYDVMLASDYDYCGHVLAEAAGIPSVVSYVATNMLFRQTRDMGIPQPISAIIDNMDPEASFTLFGKIQMILQRAMFLLHLWPQSVAKQNRLLREVYGENFPSVEEIAEKTDLVLVNSNEFVEQARLVTHKVVYIGGAALPNPKPINQNFNELLSLKTKGTVLISFGTQVTSDKVPMKIKQAFVRSIETYPEYNFIWKYDKQVEDGNLFENVTNLHLVKWMPQTDLLKDSRVVAFVTHMGLNSLLEAASSGVPLVAIPLFADQPHNAKSAVKQGYAVQLDKRFITEQVFTEALGEILLNNTYRDNAKWVASIMENTRDKMRKRFVDAVELAARHPQLHKIFNIPDVNIDMFTYYCVDVILVLISLLSIFIYISYKTLHYGYKLFVVPMATKQKCA